MFIKIQIVIFVLGSVPFTALAEEASSVLEGEESATIDFRDRNDTEFEESPTLLPTKIHSVTNLLEFAELMTTKSGDVASEDSDITADYEVTTENEGGPSREPEETEKGGLETIALAGIITGIIVAVGILAGIIIAVVRKMSGRP
ncbi:podoplanin isoform X2 [Nothoprocta perdicaria]|uniref:podoplanin isoform X2 n=1 Tax=Nothoprocta perdicaria TaxID=30464 RepID=UPI000E1BCF2D|nr:podoplanin isoform X2 [Nothoprocta perdicaria]